MSDPAIHKCEFMEYESQQLELAFPGDRKYQRWVMRNGDGLISFQVIMFCPYCGLDLRKDLWWQIPGRPRQNELMEKSRLASLGDTLPG